MRLGMARGDIGEIVPGGAWRPDWADLALAAIRASLHRCHCRSGLKRQGLRSPCLPIGDATRQLGFCTTDVQTGASVDVIHLQSETSSLNPHSATAVRRLCAQSRTFRRSGQPSESSRSCDGSFKELRPAAGLGGRGAGEGRHVPPAHPPQLRHADRPVTSSRRTSGQVPRFP